MQYRPFFRHPKYLKLGPFLPFSAFGFLVAYINKIEKKMSHFESLRFEGLLNYLLPPKISRPMAQGKRPNPAVCIKDRRVRQRPKVVKIPDTTRAYSRPICRSRMRTEIAIQSDKTNGRRHIRCRTNGVFKQDLLSARPAINLPPTAKINRKQITQFSQFSQFI